MKLKKKIAQTVSILAISTCTFILSGCDEGRQHQINLTKIKAASEEYKLQLKIKAQEVNHALTLKMHKARDIAIAAEREAARITIAAAAAVEETKRHGITMDTVRHISPFAALAAVLMSIVMGFVAWRKAYFKTQKEVIQEIGSLFEKHHESLSAQERMVLLSAIGQGSAAMSGLEYKPTK